MLGYNKEVITMEFGDRILEILKEGHADPCTEDIIWRSDLYPPIKFPSLKDLAAGIMRKARVYCSKMPIMRSGLTSKTASERLS